jgi:hypothetical protein
MLFGRMYAGTAAGLGAIRGLTFSRERIRSRALESPVLLRWSEMP